MQRPYKSTEKIVFLCVSLFIAFFTAGASLASGCLLCHSAMKGRIEGRKGFVTNVHIESEKFTGSRHGSINCTECHLTYKVPPDETVASEVAELLPYIAVKSKVDPPALGSCVRCHPGAYKSLRASIHGENIFKDRQADGPLCLDCHGNPHYIMSAGDKGSPVNHANVLGTCGRCHEKKEVVKKYKEGFHGKKYLLGHKNAPICNDCHGSHYITKWDREDSPVSVKGKVDTCGKCHEGATMKFVAAHQHKSIGKDPPIPYYAEKALILLVFGVFGFIISHVVLEAYFGLRDKFLGKKGVMNKELPGEMERFNIIFRIQYVVMLVTFLFLAFTGLALKYPEVKYSHWLIRLWGGPETAGIIHRVAGITMLINFAWHCAYVVYLYFFGLSKRRPEFGRRSYIEKFNYWAVFCGMGIMGISGFVLAFPVFATSFFPNFTLGWIWPLVRTLHSGKILFAMAFIFFWHFYNKRLFMLCLLLLLSAILSRCEPKMQADRDKAVEETPIASRHTVISELPCFGCHKVPVFFNTPSTGVFSHDLHYSMEVHCNQCHDVAGHTHGRINTTLCGRCHSLKVLAYKGGGMGKVAFNHGRHADIQGCSDCHNRLFLMKRSTGKMKMDDMYQGRSCGACHNGLEAFSFMQCANCHHQG